MEQTERAVDVQVDVELADLIRANLWYRYSKPSTQFSIVLMALLTLVFAGILLITPRWLFVLIPVALWALEGFIVLVIVIETRRNFSAGKDFQRHPHYHLTKEGYTVTAGKSSASVNWESVLKAVESKQGFNLFVGRTLFVILPRRCFKTPTDIETTREFLRAALGNKANLS